MKLMKKIILIIIVFAFIGLSAEGQQIFQKLLGSWGGAYSGQQTMDGGYILAGVWNIDSVVSGNQNAYLIKTNDNGNIVWTKTYGTPNLDLAWDVQQTSDSGYIFTGAINLYNSGPGVSGMYLIKTNSIGDTIWTKCYGGRQAYSVRQTNDGGYIVGGYKSGMYIVKTNSFGDTTWTRSFGAATGSCELVCVRQTTDGGYVLLGYSNSFGGSNVYLVKTNSNGNLLWSKIYGGRTSNSSGFALEQTNDGGYIITGITNFDVYLIKTDSIGSTQWSKSYIGLTNDYGESVKQTTDGGYIICGYTDSYGAGGTDALLIKTNATGDTIWTKVYGGTGDDRGLSVRQTTDGGYVLFGASDAPVNGAFYLIKTDANGTSGCREQSAPFSVVSLAASDSIPATIVRRGGIVSNTQTMVNSGGSAVTLCSGNSTLGVGEITKEETISLYPNPTSASFTISTTAGKIKEVKVFDVVGSLVHSFISSLGNSQCTIGIKGVSKGIYFVQIMDEKGNAVNRKVVVE